MKFRCQKTENCFAEARTYEYELPVTGEELCRLLKGWEIKENYRFRRPMFSANRGGLQIKGILASHVIKVNYTEKNWEREKEELERWLKQAE